MPRAKQLYKLKQQAGPAVPEPLTAAVQSWLLFRGLHGGPLRQDTSMSIKYKALAEAGQQEHLLRAQVLQQVINVFNF